MYDVIEKERTSEKGVKKVAKRQRERGGRKMRRRRRIKHPSATLASDNENVVELLKDISYPA